MRLSAQISSDPALNLPELNIAVISCESSKTTYSTYDFASAYVGPVPNLLLDHFANALRPHGIYSSVSFTLFDATQSQFPSSPQEFDGFLVPGSLSTAYSDVPWIVKLRGEISKLHKDKSKTLAICFGHQVYAHSSGGESKRNPLGPTLYQVACTATELGTELLGSTSFDLLSSHSDIVLQPGQDGVTLLYSDRCEHQVIGYLDSTTRRPYAITIQSHPEYCCDGQAVIEGVAKALEPEMGEVAVRSMADAVQWADCANSSKDLITRVVLALWGKP